MSQHHRTVTKERKNTSHTLHLILTILTCGMWGLFVWLPITIWHSTGPRKKIVSKSEYHQAPPQYPHNYPQQPMPPAPPTGQAPPPYHSDPPSTPPHGWPQQ